MAKTGFIAKKNGSNYYQRSGGGGNFLTPPGDAENSWHIEEERGGQVMGIMSLRYAAKEGSHVPLTVRLRAIGLLNQGKSVADEAWIHSVYNYFRNCYSPDGVDRNVSNCVIRKAGEMLPPDWHLAVMHIRQWFPQHEPRPDLIESSGPLGFWHKKGSENEQK